MQTDVSINNKECRICFEEESEDNKLIHPCLCSGTSKYIHISCLNEWRYSNVNRSSFYKCSECNYHYKIKYLYPLEYHNKIDIPGLLLISTVYTPSLIISFIVGGIDQYNNYSILNDLYYNTTNYTKFKNQIISEDSISIYWLIIFNYILYLQHIIYVIVFNLYAYYKVNKENRYRCINIHKLRFLFQIMSAFKFIISYKIFCYWSQYSNLICTMIIFAVFEVLFYYTNLKNYNKTIKMLDKKNITYILNYDENSVETENIVHFDNIQYILDSTE